MVLLSFTTSIFIAIQDPVIQKFAVRIAGGILSDKTGADVKIGRLLVTPNFTIQIDNLHINDLNDNELLSIQELRLRPYMQDIVQNKIHIGRIELNDAAAHLVTYEGETASNLKQILDKLIDSNKEKKKKEAAPIRIDRILLKDVHFELWNQNRDHPEYNEEGRIDYAHLDVDQVNMDLENLQILGDSIHGWLHHLAAEEASGFLVKYMESDIAVSPSGIVMDDLKFETSNSRFHLDLHFFYPGYQAFKHFCDSVVFDSKIYPSDIMLSDIGPFAKVMYTMPNKVGLDCFFRGPISNFHIDDMSIDLGNSTHLEGNMSMHPLNFNEGIHTLHVRAPHYTYDDLVAFHIPGKTTTIPIPEMLAPMQQGSLQLDFEGSYVDFYADAMVRSEIGDVHATINKLRDDSQVNIFESSVDAMEIDLGQLLSSPEKFGHVSLAANVIGRKKRGENMDLDIEADGHDAQLLGNSIDQFFINGNLRKKCFNGKVTIKDQLANLNVKGWFDFNNPKSLKGNVKAQIDNADLYSLHLLNNDSINLLTATIDADVRNVNDIDKLEGTLQLSNTHYTNSYGQHDLNQLNASIVNDALMQRRININSEVLDFEMAGQINFSTLGTAFKEYVCHYTNIPQWDDELARFDKKKQSSDQDFIVHLDVKEPKTITKIFNPNLTIAKNTTLNGTFTSRSNSLNMTLRSKYVRINDIQINNIECKNISSSRRSLTKLNIERLIYRDSTEHDPTQLGFDALSLSTILRNDSIIANLAWDDLGAKDHNKAFISTSIIPTITGANINISQADLLINDSLWNVNQDNRIIIDNKRTTLSDFEFFCNDQHLNVNGQVPLTHDDTLTVSFETFNISDFDPIFRGMGFDLDGTINGEATISGIKDNLMLFADLTLNELCLDHVNYGNAHVKSSWDNSQNAVLLDLGLINDEIKNIDLSGTYYPKRKKENLDFGISLQELNLHVLSPFLANAVERLQGKCDGSVTITGSIQEPSINGQLKIKDGGCKVNYLNTFYTFEPTININDRLISFNNLSLTDTLGHKALVTGNIAHNHLKDIRLTIDLFPRDFLALATTSENNSTFYGTAIADGLVEIKGPLNDLSIYIKAKTKKGTLMTIPLGGSNNIKENDFITFLEKTSENEEEEEEVTVKKKNNLRVDLDLDITQDARAKISLPNNLGNIEANGEGNLKIGSSNTSPLSLIGSYVINDGDLSLNIENILRKSFSLESGSVISWTGDPSNGTIDATGVYQTKAPISSLGLVDTTYANSNNLKVECLVHLKNELLNPDISFGLRLPNASEDLKQAVFYVIDTTNQANLFVQAISLVVLNSFSYGSNTTTSTGYNILTNHLSEWISQISHDFDINLNYKPGDNITNEELTIALKTQLFNDRLTIETNLGMIRPNSTASSRASNIVGDFDVYFKLTKDGRLNAHAFSHSNYNTYYYLYTYGKLSPQTQGIGLSFSQSFDRFSDLFKKKKNTLLPDRPLIDIQTPSSSNTNSNHEPN